MGAWGNGPFANDDALDFMNEVERHPTWDEVREEFGRVIAINGYLEAPDGSQAVAGAALVASNLGHGNFLPDDYANLLTKMGPMPLDIVSLAKQALARVLGEDSELKELWQENTGERESEYTDWLRTLTDIQDALNKST